MECGAKTRSGEPCKASAMANGRCRLHGGKSTGAKQAQRPGNSNALVHGVYSRMITSEEEPFLAQIRKQIGSLDCELAIARIQVLRALQKNSKKAHGFNRGMNWI